MDKKSVSNRTPEQQSFGLVGMAKHVKSTVTLADSGFPTEALNKLREICSQGKQRSSVTSQKSRPAKGLTVFFTGLSKARKIDAAEVIANELNLDLYRIDLTAIVSKYIGETEKNLNKVFDAAKATNAILFFDEVDALFGERSEVKDAHGRYANVELDYLIERIEDYNGIAILATNLHRRGGGKLDEAFLRRPHYIVDFPLPSTDRREEI